MYPGGNKIRDPILRGAPVSSLGYGVCRWV